MNERVKCCKCGSPRAWLERDAGGLVQRCICGVSRPVMKKAEGNITVISAAVRQCDATLPSPGTKTRKCFAAIFSCFPDTANTAEVAEIARLENKETSSLLITLMARGLVERVSERRGLYGGSEWRVTVAAQQLMSL